MKRILSVCLVLCLLFCFTACGQKPPEFDENTSTTEKGTTPTAPKVTIPATTETHPEETAVTTEPETLPELTEPITIPEPTEPEPTEPEATTTPTEPEATTTPKEPAKPVHTHSYTAKVTKAAGCTTKGVTTYSCSCGNSYTQDIAVTGHSWGDWVTTKEPTTTEAGNSQRKCKNCTATENQALPKLPAPSGGVVTQAQLDQIYDYFLMLVNMERTRVGVGTLTSNAYLDSCAQIRSSETLESFSHTRPDGQSWVTVLDTSRYPYSTAGENLCMTSHVGSGSYTAADKWVGSQEQIEAAAGWIFKLFKESPGHYANMIHESFTECGIGISYQMYGDSGIPMFYLAHIFGAR